MELSRQQVAILQQQVKTLESQMNDLKETAHAIEESCMARINNLEASYESLLAILIQQHEQDMEASSRTTSWLTSSPSHWHQANIADFMHSDISLLDKLRGPLE
jgi:phage host-nuclease inhibitor protein Gam